MNTVSKLDGACCLSLSCEGERGRKSKCVLGKEREGRIEEAVVPILVLKLVRPTDR